MDNNNTVPAQPAVNTSPPPQQPAVSPTPAASNNKILMFGIGFVVIVILIGGIYFLLSKRQAATITITKQPVVQATPAPQDTVDALDRDLSAVNVGNTDSDFSSLDQDLQSL